MVSGAVPHSGNLCSGLCRPPCPHEDCWQCADGRQRRRDELAVQKLHQMDVSAKKSGASILSAMKGDPKDWQKATITRGALEALAAKAGVRMDWNNGAPVFYDDDVRDMQRRFDVAEKKVMEEKLRELERIAAQQQSGNLTSRAARSLAEAAAKSMDTMVSDIIKARVEATLQEDIEANEARVKSQLKAKGASDADIAAVEKLMSVKAPKPEPKLKFQPELEDPLLDPARVQAQVLTATTLRQMIEGMRQTLPPGDYIVNPSVYKQMVQAEQKVPEQKVPEQKVGWKARLGIGTKVSYKGMDL